MGGSRKKGKTPYEAPDSLKSAQRLRAIGLISLGPIRGPVTEDAYQSVFFDNTPLKNAHNEWNYLNTEIAYNEGTPDQLPLEGFEASEREVPVGVEVKTALPLSRAVIDPDITRLRITLGVNALFSQDDEGNTNGTTVELEILINNQPLLTPRIEGKSSSRFFRSYILDNLPPRPFTLTVKRLTADSKSQRLQNGTFWSSYTEIIDAKLSYPNMAMVGIKTDSRYNANFPNVNFWLYGRLIKVPANYNPDSRTYSEGLWKGDFKLAWSNNPAWVFYDLVTNKLAGLGQRLGDFGVDKFQLYQIAQYCDELVDDGFGGKEPRMTANLWITEQRDAYAVISDMASVFRALVVWNGTQLTAIQDRPADSVYRFSQGNVIDGQFNRQYAPLKSIFTAVEVAYIDERNQYQKAVEYVADDQMIVRYGYNVKKMTAFGCTSRGQARRYGKWVLETSRLEQCTLTFSVGREGLMVLPGDIIEVADNSYAKANLGGRIVAVNGNQVTLDSELELDLSADSHYLTYFADKRLIRRKILQIQSDNPTQLTLAESDVALEVGEMWVLHSQLIRTERFRVLTIAENSEGSYSITALQHERQKQAIVDNSANFEPMTTSRFSLPAVHSADIFADSEGVNLQFSSPSFTGQGIRYQVKLYRDGVLYGFYDDLTEPELALGPLSDGEFVAEIRVKNAAGQLSEPTTKPFTINLTISELTATPKLFGIELNWQNPVYAKSNSAIEIWVAEDNDFSQARKLTTVSYPTNSYLYSGLSQGDSFWFWARMTDGTIVGKLTDSVLGRPEQNANKIVDYLQGQITRTELGQSLIDSLLSDINTAVDNEAQAREIALQSEAGQRIQALQAEAQTRQSALQAEAEARQIALQSEAQARGTAVSQLQRTNENQAQLINTATAKAQEAIAGLQQEQTARIAGDRSESQAREALTGRVSNSESNISQIRRTQATQQNANAQQFNSLNTQIGDVQSSINTERSARIAGDRANTNEINTLKSKVSNSESSISQIRRTQATQQNANAQQFNSLNTQIGDVQSSINTERSARIAGDRANTNEINTLKSKVSNSESSISQIRRTLSDTNQSIAQMQDRLVARVNNAFSESKNLWSVKGTRRYVWLSDGTVLQGFQDDAVSDFIPVEEGQTYIIQIWGKRRYQLNLFWNYFNASKQFIREVSARVSDVGQDQPFHITSKFRIPSGVRFIRISARNLVRDVKYKFEKGTTATEWSVADADVTHTVATAERNTEAYANQFGALSRRIDTLTAEHNGTKAEVSQTTQAVAQTNGKINAMHTVKLETVAGGRKAVTGFTLGVDGQTAETSVIVMADKFSVVKNAYDRQVTPMFSVVNNKVAINGDLIANGTITGDKIAANTEINSPSVQGGWINGTEISSARFLSSEGIFNDIEVFKGDFHNAWIRKFAPHSAFEALRIPTKFNRIEHNKYVYSVKIYMGAAQRGRAFYIINTGQYYVPHNYLDRREVAVVEIKENTMLSYPPDVVVLTFLLNDIQQLHNHFITYNY